MHVRDPTIRPIVCRDGSTVKFMVGAGIGRGGLLDQMIARIDGLNDNRDDGTWLLELVRVP